MTIKKKSFWVGIFVSAIYVALGVIGFNSPDKQLEREYERQIEKITSVFEEKDYTSAFEHVTILEAKFLIKEEDKELISQIKVEYAEEKEKVAKLNRLKKDVWDYVNNVWYKYMFVEPYASDSKSLEDYGYKLAADTYRISIKTVKEYFEEVNRNPTDYIY